METSKEELESSNEELTTLNEELNNRNTELGRLNSDVANFISSVQIPILMLDGQLRIRRFTPAAEKLLKLIQTDVGRPISDLKLNLDFPDLERLIQEVIDTVSVKEVEARDGAVRFAVRDQGPGVSPDFVPRLFQKFSQEAAAARGSTGRFGLGLATARMLVERMGGRIGYEPAPGGGSVFWFRLPAVEA